MDRGGKIRKMGAKESNQEATFALLTQKLEEQKSNTEVGDFLSELTAVMRTRTATGLLEGDWIEDPERIYSDHGVFGEEVRTASDFRFQISVCVDVSRSTYYNGAAVKIANAFVALDKTIRKAVLELPEGQLSYNVFAFNRDTYLLGPAQVARLDIRASNGGNNLVRWGTYWFQPIIDGKPGLKATGLTYDQMLRKRDLYPCSKEGYEHNWHDTKLAPLFGAIEAWENQEGDHRAYRLDIILSDGELNDPKDIAEANRIQERRNGRLTTFMLNFLPKKEWGQYHLPERCYQYEASVNLGQQLRQIITDALLEI